MSFPRYSRYRPSGIEWIGEVPKDWEVVPLKYVSSLKGRLGWQGLRADEYTEDGPFLVTSEHFNNDRIEWLRCYHVSRDRYALAPEIQLRAHDLLLMKDGAAMGKLAYVDHLPGPACLNSHLLLFRPTNGRFVNRFLYYVLGGPIFKTYMEQRRTGTTFFGISQESIGAFPLIVPPIDQQNSIIVFLDRESAKIDGLVAEQRRLIELLKEKRQAVISHAVTKGLNPHAPMKPSGIEWLGDVPEHWEVTKVKHLVYTIEQGWSPQCEGFPVESPEQWGVLKVGCVNTGVFNPDENKLLPDSLPPIPALAISRGDLLISRANTRELVGRAAVADMDYPNLLLCDKLYRLRLHKDIGDAKFLSLFLSSDRARGPIELGATGASASMVNIAQSVILELMMSVPSVEEQKRIVEMVQHECRAMDMLTAEAERTIDLLQERRTALISAAVTGKIDVRGLVKTEAA